MIPLQIRLAIAAVALCVTFISGWVVHGWKFDAALKAEADAALVQKEQYDELSRQLVKRYLELQETQKIVYRDIKKDIPNVTDNRVCFADANAWSLYNDSLQGVSRHSTGTTKTPTRTDTVTDREALGNAVENFQQYKECRDQLNGIIDWRNKTRGEK